MKKMRFVLIAGFVAFAISSCSMFKPKYGCGTDGKNIGAEKVLGMEKPPKAKKFKA